MTGHLSILLLSLAALAAPAHAIRAEGQEPEFEQVLARTGRSVEIFWHGISSVACLESVTQEKLDARGKVAHRQKSEFDYLIVAGDAETALTVQESRIPKSPVRAAAQPMLTTSGFPTLLLIFHPRYRDSYRFSPDGAEVSGGQSLQRIRFAHIPGTRSTSALALPGRTVPLDLEGVAWVEPETGSIRRIVAGLMSPPEGINLRVFQATVEYAPQRFSSSTGIAWLPVMAAVDFQTARQHWRNVHRFTGYRRFSVQVDKADSK